MTVRIVRLGSPRAPDEGLRVGTVRRPPRGVRKTEFASGDWYDVWFPNLAPSAPLVAAALRATTAAERRAFARGYVAEMAEPGPSRDLDLIAALSHRTNLSVGCYCEDESRCHRSLLRRLLERRGAAIG
ncbi:MAG TPA: DUF488 family protein [Burkholderiaceae bacterium]|nr:DUF488 family protein [Burkholderiaceae bacterium]